jgi:dihydrofolate reductase
MTLILIFCSNSDGYLGFYNLLPNLFLNEFQNLKNKSIFNIIFCGIGTYHHFFYNYLICRFFFIISSKYNFYNNINLFSFINFYINFILNKYVYYNFFLFSNINLNNVIVYGGSYIYSLYFIFINKLIISLFLKKLFGNILFPIYFFNFWYIFFLSKHSKFVIVILKKKNKFNFFKQYF